MIEMSVDDKKETVLPSERPGDTSLPPPAQRGTLPLDKYSEHPQEPLEKGTTNQDGTHSLADQGSVNPEEPAEHGNMDNLTNQAGPDPSPQSLNGVQQPKSHPRLNKRRSTMNTSFKHPIFGKRRRRATSESESVLPTHFFLGGNIFDPLNLNSMLDEEVNRVLNAETPKSSPLPVKNRDPVEILIPRDITDPLNLKSSMAGDGGLLLTPLKSGGGGRKRHRNRHHGVMGVGGGGSGKSGDGGALLPLIGDLSEIEKGKTCLASQKESQTELAMASTSASSLAPCLDSVAAEAPMEEALESNSIPTQEAPCPSALNSSSSSAAGGDAEDEKPKTSSADPGPAPSTTVSPTAPSSHRQRKRKRTSSKSENFGAPYCDKNNATSSCGNRNQGTGFDQLSQQHHTNQRKQQNQKNQQKPNRPNHYHHQQQQQQHHQKKKKKFQYGNYDKYYGYRNPGLTEDPRLRTLKPEWFQGKEVLDLGCNTGRLTLSIAMNWKPSRIIGLDIDGSLIHAAKKNILYFLSEMHVQKARSGRKDESAEAVEKPEKTENSEKPEKMVEEPSTIKEKDEGNGIDAGFSEETNHSGGSLEMKEAKEVRNGENETKESKVVMAKDEELESGGRNVDGSGVGVDGNEAGDEDVKKRGEGEAVSASSASSSNGNCVFPVSLRIFRGPIAAPPLPDDHPPSPGNFPANVSFVRGNYVLESDVLLVSQREEFDVILCMSVTKWVHLNWGDEGLKRLFHRVYRHLRPGGRFILEPQPWTSYSKRKKLTETITKNYYSISLKPEHFSSYLTNEVGFSSYELIGTPNNLSRGFQRPIYVFYKGSAPQK